MAMLHGVLLHGGCEAFSACLYCMHSLLLNSNVRLLQHFRYLEEKFLGAGLCLGQIIATRP